LLALSTNQVYAESVSVGVEQKIETQSTNQVESKIRVRITKTPEQIEAYKQELRQQKQQLISEEREQARVEKQEMIRQQTTEKLEDRCEMISAKINNRINLYENSKDKYHSRFQGIAMRLNDLAENLENRGCDVSPLRSDLDEYNTLLSEFAAAFRDFHLSLIGSRQYVCGESEGQFSSQISQSKPKLQLAKQKARALQNFVLNTLQPQLRSTAQACSITVQPTVEPTSQPVIDQESN